MSLLTQNRDRALQEPATGVRLIQQSQATVSPPFLGLYPLLVAVAGEGRQARTEAVRLRSSDATRHQIVADLLRCVDAVLAGREGPRSGRGDSVVPPDLLAQGVTSREVDVLNLVAEGLTNAELAARLHLSPRTVEKHVASLLGKTGCRRRAQPVAYVVRLSG